ncbi:hypothetical protein DFJ58DRAFT_401877 [Suillus subalutaceus]|uniref:uncharacterized protein n=1 Tax=Suillus subalutaceus TaxID=48586 RepID=UPI001B88680D|nr:uncharacterized protein DFJ58DRAFT_401877 [Suillus subalutaceus]KAG1852761.1 hypothetical protein DFJ58DRAFT_401877 [Suillus subalutaceus]
MVWLVLMRALAFLQLSYRAWATAASITRTQLRRDVVSAGSLGQQMVIRWVTFHTLVSFFESSPLLSFLVDLFACLLS